MPQTSPQGFDVDAFLSLVDAAVGRSNRPHSVDHGEHHWQLVVWTGAQLIRETPAADPVVVFLFGLFHDSMRENDYVDPGHGARGGALARKLLDGRGLVTGEQLETLVYACERHTDAITTDDLTVGTCWDSDRLNLWRVAIEPDAERLCTAAAKKPERIEWAESLQEETFTWEEICGAYAQLDTGLIRASSRHSGPDLKDIVDAVRSFRDRE